MIPAALLDRLKGLLPWVVVLLAGMVLGGLQVSRLNRETARDLGKAEQARDACIASAKKAADLAETRAKQAAAAVEAAKQGRSAAEAETARIRGIKPGNDACAAALRMNQEIVKKERGT